MLDLKYGSKYIIFLKNILIHSIKLKTKTKCFPWNEIVFEFFITLHLKIKSKRLFFLEIKPNFSSNIVCSISIPSLLFITPFCRKRLYYNHIICCLEFSKHVNIYKCIYLQVLNLLIDDIYCFILFVDFFLAAYYFVPQVINFSAKILEVWNITNVCKKFQFT